MTKIPKDVWQKHDEFTTQEIEHIAILLMDVESQRTEFYETEIIERKNNFILSFCHIFIFALRDLQAFVRPS